MPPVTLGIHGPKAWAYICHIVQFKVGIRVLSWNSILDLVLLVWCVSLHARVRFVTPARPANSGRAHVRVFCVYAAS
eukprot:COSAG02_NODE_25611_length_653_cov_1.234657_1_plen_77_part_00